MLTRKRKDFLRKILGYDPGLVLDCLSSEHCEGDFKEFKENYGVTSKEAQKAIEALLKFLEK